MPSIYVKKLPAIEYRIARRIRPNGECREWTGTMNRKDKVTGLPTRPVVGYQAGQVSVTRLVWELAHGPIPEKLWMLHTCDNPKCIRTSHLYPGTPSRNSRDAVERGRWRAPKLDNHNMAKLTIPQVIEIRARYAAGWIEQKALAAEYGVSASNINVIVKGKTWSL